MWLLLSACWCMTHAVVDCRLVVWAAGCCSLCESSCWRHCTVGSHAVGQCRARDHGDQLAASVSGISRYTGLPCCEWLHLMAWRHSLSSLWSAVLLATVVLLLVLRQRPPAFMRLAAAILAPAWLLAAYAACIADSSVALPSWAQPAGLLVLLPAVPAAIPTALLALVALCLLGLHRRTLTRR